MECSERLEDARFSLTLCRIDAEHYHWVNELLCYLSLLLEPQLHLLLIACRPLFKKSPLIRYNAANLLIIAVIYSHILCEVVHIS